MKISALFLLFFFLLILRNLNIKKYFDIKFLLEKKCKNVEKDPILSNITPFTWIRCEEIYPLGTLKKESCVYLMRYSPPYAPRDICIKYFVVEDSKIKEIGNFWEIEKMVSRNLKLNSKKSILSSAIFKILYPEILGNEIEVVKDSRVILEEIQKLKGEENVEVNVQSNKTLEELGGTHVKREENGYYVHILFLKREEMPPMGCNLSETIKIYEANLFLNDDLSLKILNESLVAKINIMKNICIFI